MEFKDGRFIPQEYQDEPAHDADMLGVPRDSSWSVTEANELWTLIINAQNRYAGADLTRSPARNEVQAVTNHARGVQRINNMRYCLMQHLQITVNDEDLQRFLRGN